MRTFIYNRLKNLAGIPAKFGTPPRIISTGNNEDNPQKPFLLVAFDIETKPLDSVAEMRVSRIPFTVWVHDEPGTMLDIDEAAFAIKNGLPTPDGAAVGNMSHYGITWEEIGGDTADDHFGTNTRPVRFWMVARHSG